MDVTSIYRYPSFLRGNGKNLFIDIWLDCDEGVMKLQLMDPKKNNNSFAEIKVEEMPSSKNKYKFNLPAYSQRNDEFKGYVPQFNIYNTGIKVQIAKIPIEYYGCQIDNDIFAKVL